MKISKFLKFSEFNSVDNKVIRFGRKKGQNQNINVAFTEDSTSRFQCTISYDEYNRSWKIIDGDGAKKSLNGTWVLADEYILIEKGMQIRVGTTTFEADLCEVTF